MITNKEQIKILISALVADVIPIHTELITALASQTYVVAIAQTFSSPKLLRELRLVRNDEASGTSLKVEQEGNRVLYQGQAIGRIQILFKSPLPGELQARLAIESALDRFLEYLQKLHQIVALDESDRHVCVFIPVINGSANFKALWQSFLTDIAFSAYGNTKHQLPGLVQTFIVMLNAITLSGRGFSTLDIPILTQEQSDVLAAWYLAVIQEVEKRQTDRQEQINRMHKELRESELSDKERQVKEKDLQQKEAMQSKEAKKYNEYFQKAFGNLEAQNGVGHELEAVQSELAQPGLTKTQPILLV